MNNQRTNNIIFDFTFFDIRSVKQFLTFRDSEFCLNKPLPFNFISIESESFNEFENLEILVLMDVGLIEITSNNIKKSYIYVITVSIKLIQMHLKTY